MEAQLQALQSELNDLNDVRARFEERVRAATDRILDAATQRTTVLADEKRVPSWGSLWVGVRKPRLVLFNERATRN